MGSSYSVVNPAMITPHVDLALSEPAEIIGASGTLAAPPSQLLAELEAKPVPLKVVLLIAPPPFKFLDFPSALFIIEHICWSLKCKIELFY